MTSTTLFTPAKANMFLKVGKLYARAKGYRYMKLNQQLTVLREYVRIASKHN